MKSKSGARAIILHRCLLCCITLIAASPPRSPLAISRISQLKVRWLACSIFTRSTNHTCPLIERQISELSGPEANLAIWQSGNLAIWQSGKPPPSQICSASLSLAGGPKVTYLDLLYASPILTQLQLGFPRGRQSLRVRMVRKLSFSQTKHHTTLSSQPTVP